MVHCTQARDLLVLSRALILCLYGDPREDFVHLHCDTRWRRMNDWELILKINEIVKSKAADQSRDFLIKLCHYNTLLHIGCIGSKKI